MRALGKQRDRAQKLGDLAFGVVMAEDRQAEGGFGDEDIALHQLERRAGWVGHVLVVAGGDDAHAAAFHRDLRGAEHMAGGVEGGLDPVEVDGFAIFDGLGAPGEIIAIAQPHDVERLLRGQDGAMAGAGMVRMAMGDECLVHRPRRVDVELAALAAHAGRGGQEDVFGTHKP